MCRSTGLELEPVVFEANSPESYSETGPHYILWRWAVEVLLEMGLGGRLSRIAAPIVNFTSTETASEEVIVQWPPVSTSKDHIEAEIGLDSALPPMVAIRRCDLLRMLLLALSGVRDDVVYGDDYLPTSANNSDLVADPVEDLDADLAHGRWFENEGFADLVPELHFNEKLQSYSIDSVTGEVTARFESGRMEKGFLLIGADGVHSTVRKLMYQPKDVFNARSLFPSAPEPPLRHMASHVGACVIYGVTKLHVPPVDMPDVFENGKPIEDLTRNDVHNFCPDGRAVSVVDKGISFHLTNLGNGMLGWNLIVAQSEPYKYASEFALQRTRRLLSESIAKNPRQSILMLARNKSGDSGESSGSSSRPNKIQLSSLSAIKTDTRSAEDKWGGLQIPQTTSPEPRSPETLSSSTSTTLIGKLAPGMGRPGMPPRTETSPQNVNNSGEGTSSDSSKITLKQRSTRKAVQNIDLSDPNLHAQLNQALNPADHIMRASSAHSLRQQSRYITTGGSVGNASMLLRNKSGLASKNPHRVSMPLTPLAFTQPSTPTGMPDLFGTEPPSLTGTESRALALRLSQSVNLPHPCHAIIARTDPRATRVTDVEDLSDDPLDTLTIPVVVSSTPSNGGLTEVTGSLSSSPARIASLSTSPVRRAAELAASSASSLYQSAAAGVTTTLFGESTSTTTTTTTSSPSSSRSLRLR